MAASSTATTDRYSDRVRSAAATLAALQPHLSTFGITRLANQTGLDAIGIACYAAFRPNSAALATTQGKGLTPDDAKVSALMEAAEQAIAEAPQTLPGLMTASDLRRDRRALHLPNALPPRQKWPEDVPLAWSSGQCLFTGAPILMPRDAVALGPHHPALSDLCQSTNGLASGNVADEAVLHGVCELIERDAMTLWSFRAQRRAASSRLDPAAFSDPQIDDLNARITNAGFSLRLFDLTTDIGVPVIMALIAADQPQRHFDLASGVGCHPNAVRAALRAITEAAQTRITNIAASRDDIDPDEYDQPLSASLLALTRIEQAAASLPTGLRGSASLPELLDFVKARLTASGIGKVTIVPLGGGDQGIAVIRALSPQLEDRPANRHWQPGARALGAMLAP